MNQTPITLILAATLGAGAMFAIQPPLPPVCEPVELLRFVGREPEIHVVSETTYGRSTADWLQQFEDTPPVAEEQPVRRRRRHGRW
jgi:hypothetical protein